MEKQTTEDVQFAETVWCCMGTSVHVQDETCGTRLRNIRGFTLIETVVVIALFSILSLAIFESIALFYKYHGYTVAQSYQVDHARRGIDELVRDLREMTFADDGTFPLVHMEDTRIGFYSDIDRDDSVEYVTYILSSTTLEKQIFNATGSPPTYSTTSPDIELTISEYVQNDVQNIPIFVYYDVNGIPATATTTATDVRYVQLNIIVNIDPIRDPNEFMLRSSAALRNLK